MKPEDEILRTLKEAGFKAYIVGGAVRDRLLGLEIKDIDIATDATPEEVIELFDKTVPTGLKYGTVEVLKDGRSFQVTTFRTDGSYSDGRRPDEVRFGTSFKDDLSRRDFTVNALALDEDGKLIDYYGGLDDLKARIIRAIGSPEKRFREDGLRKWRAVRFACTKNFKIEDKTFKAITTDPGTDQISIERITAELLGILSSENPDYGFDLIFKSGLLSSLLGRLGVEESISPPELSGAKTLEARLALLTKTYGISFLEGLRLPKRTVKTARLLCELMACESEKKFNKTARKLSKSVIIDNLSLFDKEKRDWAKKLAQSPAFERKELAVDGNDLLALGLTGKLSDVFEDLLDYVTEHPGQNTKPALRNFILEKRENGTYIT